MTTFIFWCNSNLYIDVPLIAWLCFLANDVIMIITIGFLLYEWYFVVTNQDVYTCQTLTSKIWKIGLFISVFVHTAGVVFRFIHSHIDPKYVLFDIGYLYSILLWFLCFCWEYYKMNRRSFTASVNRNLNLSSFILKASFITLFEACINIIPTTSHKMFKTSAFYVAALIGLSLAIIGLLILIIKIYVFRQRRKKESILPKNSGMIIDKAVIAALFALIIGVITSTAFLSCETPHYYYNYAYGYYYFHVTESFVFTQMVAFAPLSMIFGCAVIFFNIVSVTIT